MAIIPEPQLYNAFLVITPHDGTALSATESAMSKTRLGAWVRELWEGVQESPDFQRLPNGTTLSMEVEVRFHQVGGQAFEIGPITGVGKVAFITNCQDSTGLILAKVKELPFWQ